jgi:spectinomycin phosphotransferase
VIEKPDISDEKIISALKEHYSIPVVEIEFLPIGNDPSAWAYRVKVEAKTMYFLKIRKVILNLAGFFVPRFLQDHGIVQILAPLPTEKQELWIPLEDFFLFLYPFVDGTEVMKIGMTDSLWIELGSLLKRIHQTELPPEISHYVRRETFIPRWSTLVKGLHKHVGERSFDDRYQKELAAFWEENIEIIQILVERTERLGKLLQQSDLEFVLCHADIHTANILVTKEQDIFIVDWDDTLLAPKERDLMFVLEGNTSQTREEQFFLDGYGNTEMNQLAFAYYRYEWCVQEIGDFGNRIFLSKEIGTSTKQAAVQGFKKLFAHGDVIETALHTQLESELRNRL